MKRDDYTARYAADVGATIGPEGATITLPRLSVVVEVAQARRLRDALNAVLPEQIADLMHDPRVSDVHVLEAAQAILAERGQDTENLGVAIEHLERTGHVRLHASASPRCEGDGRIALVTSPGAFETCSTCGGSGKRAAKVERRLHLLSIAGDVEPALSGAYDTERERLEAAADYRRAHGPEDGLYRVDVTGDPDADVRIEAFGAGELPASPRNCVLCRCEATGEVYGFAVCDYHVDHTEDEPRCPNCAGKHTCERCENRNAETILRDVALCGRCSDVVASVAVGDRVRDPLDGTWREIVGIDGLIDGGTCHMADGGCMSLDECTAAEKRLPSEEVPS
ncbi:MAG: hypothetical protein OXJ62_00415 [Spirochaetaceae bacterium]|nr:hypothetical protein [Spirochaetaceae bacterium]